MAPSTITTALATEEDGPVLASIMTLAFAASDAAYTIIWGSATAGTHDTMALKLFEPVQKEGRITFKAIDSASGETVGFASWMMPREKVSFSWGGLPPIPGVNTKLWNDKSVGPTQAMARDEDVEKDMRLAFFFVHPVHQNKGIGSLLLEWGKVKADELGAKTWLTATPQATSVYEKHGWKIVENFITDLGEYGGEGLYVRNWMVREPREV